MNGLLELARSENIDWFIPASHATYAIADAQVKDRLTVLGKKCLAMDEVTTCLLDDKMQFLLQCRNLDLPVPHCKQVDGVEEVDNFSTRRLFEDKHYFMKVIK